MKVTPLGDRILVKMVESETKTAGGILIPQTAQERPRKGSSLLSVMMKPSRSRQKTE